MKTLNEILKEFDEKIHTPPVADMSLECINCGTDMGLEGYQSFNDGFETAKSLSKQFITSIYTDLIEELEAMKMNDKVEIRTSLAISPEEATAMKMQQAAYIDGYNKAIDDIINKLK